MFADLDSAVFFNDDIVYVNTNSDNATFHSNDMGLVNIDLINVSLNDDNFHDDDPKTIIHIGLMV